MASGGEIRAGRAYVEVTSKDAGLRAGLDAAAQRVARFGAAVRSAGSAMAGIGSLASGALAGTAATFANTGEALLRMSQRTGIAVESLSTLGSAAGQCGADLEAVQAAVLKMDRTLTEAAGGSREAELALSRLGVTVADLNGLTADQRLKLLADKLAAVNDPAVRAGLAAKVFGRGVVDLLPLLAMGGKGIDALQARARDLGLQWSTADAEAAGRFGSAMRELWAVVQRGVDAIGSAMVPQLQRAAEVMTVNASTVVRWVGEHKTLIATAGAVASAVAGIGTAIVVAGIVIDSAVTVTGLLTGAMSALGAVAAAAAGIVGGLLTTAFGLVGVAASAAAGIVTGAWSLVAAVPVAIATAFSVTGGVIAAVYGFIVAAGTAVLAVPAAIAGAFTAMWAAITAPAFLVGAAVLAIGAAVAYAVGQVLVSSGLIGRAMNALVGHAASAIAAVGRTGAAAGREIGHVASAAAAATRSALADAGRLLSEAFDAIRPHVAAVWVGLQSDALAAFAGIRDALSAGDFQTAAAIIGTTIKLVIARATRDIWEPLIPTFIRVRAALLNAWADMVAGIRTAWSFASEYLSDWSWIEPAVDRVLAGLRVAFARFWDYIRGGFAAVWGAVRSELQGLESHVSINTTFRQEFGAGNKTFTPQMVQQLYAQLAPARAADPSGHHLTQEQFHAKYDSQVISGETLNRFVAAIEAAAAKQLKGEDDHAGEESLHQRVAELEKKYGGGDGGGHKLAPLEAADVAARMVPQAGPERDRLAESLNGKALTPEQTRRLIEADRESTIATNDKDRDRAIKETPDHDPRLDGTIRDLEGQLKKLGEKAAGENQAVTDKRTALADQLAAARAQAAKAAAGLDGVQHLGGGQQGEQLKDGGFLNQRLAGEIFGNGGGGTTQQRIAKATERTADNTDPRKQTPVGDGRPANGEVGTPGRPVGSGPPIKLDLSDPIGSRRGGGLAGMFRAAVDAVPTFADSGAPDGAGLMAGLNAAAGTIFGGGSSAAARAAQSAMVGGNSMGQSDDRTVAVLGQILQAIRDGTKVVAVVG